MHAIYNYFSHLRRNSPCSLAVLLAAVLTSGWIEPLSADGKADSHGNSAAAASDVGVRAISDTGICPTELFTQAQNDSSGSWLQTLAGVNAASCYEHTSGLDDDLSKAEKQLTEALTKNLSLQSSPHSVAGCLPSAQSPQELAQQKAVVAEFHISSARLDSSATELIALQQELNTLLPDKLEIAEPSNMTPQARKAWQESSNACKNNPHALEELSTETQQALASLQQAQDYVAQNPDKKKELEQYKESLLQLYPWLQNDRFSKALSGESMSPDAVQSALTSHLSELRQAAHTQLSRLHQAGHCLAGAGSEDCWESYAETLASTPELQIDNAQKELQSAFQNGELTAPNYVPQNEGLNWLSAGMCTQGMRDKVAASSKATNGLLISTGLTLATFGIGSLVTGTAAVAGTGTTAALQTANAASKAGQAWKVLSAARVGSVHRAAAQMPKLVSAARLSVLAADTGGAAQGIAEAKRVCAEEESTLVKNSSAGSLGPACSQHARQTQLAKAERGCAQAISLAGLGLLPFVPAVLNSSLRVASKSSKQSTSDLAAAASQAPELKPSSAFAQPPEPLPKASSGFAPASPRIPAVFKSTSEVTDTYVDGAKGAQLGGPTGQAKSTAKKVEDSIRAGEIDRRSVVSELTARIGELELQTSLRNGMGGRFNPATDLPAERVSLEVAEASAQKSAEIQYYKELVQILTGADNMKQGPFGVQ